MLAHQEFAPASEAAELADVLTSLEDVQREILTETIESATTGEIRESGRTICHPGGALREPIHRFPRSVELSACPVDGGAIMHTHVTQNELRTPTHSLPDIANVIFSGGVQASMVLGVESSDVWQAPANREAAVEEFQSILGLAVQSTRELVRALDDGRIPIHRAPQLRERAQQTFSELHFRVQTSFPELQTQISQLSIPVASAVHTCGSVPSAVKHEHLDADAGRRSMALHRRARTCQPLVRQVTAGVNVQELTVATIIGNIVGGVTDHILFDG